jgi:LmbE family N-acetylglucosaminyl deacetylase
MLSAQTLGAGEVLFLDQADTADPGASGAGSWDQPYLVSALGDIIEQSKPALILTHGPRGGYGHPAHRLAYACVTAASRQTLYSGSIFSFCGQVKNAFFSWHFDQPSDVLVDARGYLRRRAASLCYHQSQVDLFLQPHFPRTVRKHLSAMFGFAFAFREVGRKRVPIGTATRFFKKFPVEGLVMQRAPIDGRPHFFLEHYSNDDRVQIVRLRGR